MKTVMTAAVLAACALSAPALDNTITWNGFWDTTVYTNATVSVSTAEPISSVNLWFCDKANSDVPEWFETLQIGFLLFLR